jgi:hypothetical protein
MSDVVFRSAIRTDLPEIVRIVAEPQNRPAKTGRDGGIRTHDPLNPQASERGERESHRRAVLEAVHARRALYALRSATRDD